MHWPVPPLVRCTTRPASEGGCVSTEGRGRPTRDYLRGRGDKGALYGSARESFLYFVRSVQGLSGTPGALFIVPPPLIDRTPPPSDPLRDPRTPSKLAREASRLPSHAQVLWHDDAIYCRVRRSVGLHMAPRVWALPLPASQRQALQVRWGRRREQSQHGARAHPHSVCFPRGGTYLVEVPKTSGR